MPPATRVSAGGVVEPTTPCLTNTSTAELSPAQVNRNPTTSRRAEAPALAAISTTCAADSTTSTPHTIAVPAAS